MVRIQTFFFQRARPELVVADGAGGVTNAQEKKKQTSTNHVLGRKHNPFILRKKTQQQQGGGLMSDLQMVHWVCFEKALYLRRQASWTYAPQSQRDLITPCVSLQI